MKRGAISLPGNAFVTLVITAILTVVLFFIIFTVTGALPFQKEKIDQFSKEKFQNLAGAIGEVDGGKPTQSIYGFFIDKRYHIIALNSDNENMKRCNFLNCLCICKESSCSNPLICTGFDLPIKDMRGKDFRFNNKDNKYFYVDIFKQEDFIKINYIEKR